MEQVILAFETEKNSHRIKDILEGAGIAECVICHSAAEVKRLTGEQGILAVACGYKLRDETAEGLFEDLPTSCSMLVLAAQNMLDMISTDEIVKLPAPAVRNELIAAVRELLRRGRRIERYVRTQRPQEETAAIERAKLVLMTERGMSEDEAHRFLQKKSMDSGARLFQTAQMVLDGTLRD